jgi:hypothetical protein
VEKQMSLFPEENMLTKEIESWRGLADGLKSEEDKKLFLEMLEKCQKYSVAINGHVVILMIVYRELRFLVSPIE